MKRLIVLLLCVVLLCSFAFAESNFAKTYLLSLFASTLADLSTPELSLNCYYDETLDMLIFTIKENTIDSGDWESCSSVLKEVHHSGALTLVDGLTESLKEFGYPETHVISLFTLSDSSIQYVFIDEIDVVPAS